VFARESSLRAETLNVPIKANVNGTMQTIGGVSVNDKFPGANADAVKSGLTATFSFETKFGFLDKYYDFDWVQIVTAETKPEDDELFFPTPLPTIDPRPSDNPDKYPFYYSMKEWNDNEFIRKIHEDGKSSIFDDVPNRPKGSIFSFTNFLVVRDNGKWSLGGKKMFCVLGGFKWTYSGDDGTLNKNRGSSTIGDAIASPVTAGNIDSINAAIANGAASANDDDYRAWKMAATNSCTLVPEPPAVSAAFIALNGLLTSSWSFRSRRARPCKPRHSSAVPRA
jgi:hypothetical protein